MSESSKSMQGKVVLVTGAGRGIGREIALLAAREGAAVVVNDLGVDPSGAGADVGPAQEVVSLIESEGGRAIVNGDSVADPAGAQRMVEAGISAFGQLDCVINNAGILRDSIFHKMSHDAWNQVISVHLGGAFNVSRAAAMHFKERNAGSMVHFTSTSGLIGNFGQANYAAAKLGMVALSKSIALDMARFNVRSNCIAPFAWSRLIGTIPTDTPEQQARVAKIKTMTADKVAPLAVFLASDLSREVTGQIFAARKNEMFLISQPRPIRSVHSSDGWTPQSLAERMLPAFKSGFYALDRTADVFSWDPI